MSTGCVHYIRVNNYAKASSTTPSPVIIIRGTVYGWRPTCSPSHVSVTNLTTSVVSQPFTVSNKSKNGEFKALLSLVLGPNQLKINYCSAQHNFSIHYAPNNSPYVVRVLYIVCKGEDGRFHSPFPECGPVDARRKIGVACELVRTIFAEKLYELGHGRVSFRMDISDGCELFKSDLTGEKAELMSEQELYEHFAKEIVTRLRHSAFEKYVAFLGCARFLGFRDERQRLKYRSMAHVALGGGDLALFGTGCLYTWPSTLDEVIAHFQDNRRVDVDRFMDNSNGRKTFAGCWSTNLGSLCHEMGHIFGLGHTADGIMGGGVDHVNRVFTVDNTTECVAERVIGHSGRKEVAALDPRLTSVQRKNVFLDKYQEQRENDLTYFAKCSAIVLATHKWLRQSAAPDEMSISNKIFICGRSRTVSSERLPFRLIEFRRRQNALMVNFFSFNQNEDIQDFYISKEIELDNINVFAMDVDGNYNIFSIDDL